MVFLLQKEVVDKICAQSGTGDYSSLSVLVQTYYNCKTKLLVGPENFRPRPKVNSKLLLCERREVDNLPDYEVMSTLLRQSFLSCRKTIRNNLGRYWSDVPIDLDKRPGQIPVEKYIELALIRERIQYSAAAVDSD
jgi:16S rRNA (adenine1518-N6/adenine1519-N6)-dimethyltransferase